MVDAPAQGGRTTVELNYMAFLHFAPNCFAYPSERSTWSSGREEKGHDNGLACMALKIEKVNVPTELVRRDCPGPAILLWAPSVPLPLSHSVEGRDPVRQAVLGHPRARNFFTRPQQMGRDRSPLPGKCQSILHGSQPIVLLTRHSIAMACI